MLRNGPLFALLLFASCLLYTTQAARGRYNYYRKSPTMPSTEPPSPPQTAKEYLDSQSGFSTFGIIAIIFAVILFCLIFYYGIICYPLLFKDDKKYRFMDVSSTMTAATPRSIQSLDDHFAMEQKH